MTGIALIIAGAIPFYTRSKHYPSNKSAFYKQVPIVFGYIFSLLAIAYYVYTKGWALGLLIWLIGTMTSFILLMLLTVLPRIYTIIIFCLLLVFLFFNIYR